MKQFKLNEAIVRMIVVILLSIPAYLVYLVINPWISSTSISFGYAAGAAILGFLINFINPSTIKQKAMPKIVVAAGIIICIILSYIAKGSANIMTFLTAVILLLWIWSRGIKGYFEEYDYIYSINQFYQTIVLLSVLNIFTALNKTVHYVQPFMARYTILYIIMAILILFQVRNNKYLKDIKERKSSYEIFMTIGMLAVTLIMATEGAVGVAVNIFKGIFGFIYPPIFKLAMIILTPILYLLDYIFALIKPGFNRYFEQLGDAYGEFDKLSPKNYEQMDYQPSYFSTRLLNTLTIITMIVIALIAIYIIYKSIDRFVKKKKIAAFTEEKDFELNISLAGVGKLFGGIKNKAVNAYKQATFNLTADNREKLRHEYKAFLNKIYNKKLIQEENLTAQEVQTEIIKAFPNAETNISFVTISYENVRYGSKMPSSEELKTFKLKIVELLRAIG